MLPSLIGLALACQLCHNKMTPDMYLLTVLGGQGQDATRAGFCWHLSSSFEDSCLLTCSRGFFMQAHSCLCLPLTRTPVIADQGSNLMAAFNLSDLFKGPISKCSRFGDSDLSPWIGCERCSVAQLCLTLGDPMDCSPPGSSVHGVLQARILKWVTIPSPRRSSRPRDWTPRLLCLLHWQADSLPPSHLGSPMNLLRGGERHSSF